MIRLLLALQLLLTSTYACTTAMNCSLNGLCKSGRCMCDAPWSGIRCGVVNVAAAAPGGAYGWHPNVSSWGGNPVHGDDGKHHLFVAEIPGG